ncbi:CaiB/BaiF CoA transferase family protein [Aquabacter spiritensis]|uniref:Crotonobetainyl-CoA:carnitine CoA-transferase CaiB-like acyl-CoA transferase n=1 Tax=Aquabacter spiritensis TaxID=933073 RepID=A0A4R3LYR6_9HYPH|nr:CoA transferase [Aquabacter spiritensis]TCT04999.1 crotonobetainyl-CoA:carnitine CoA-transferase CaiB-like acyl-CoA transferase [Aquabacter spiritensis]
MAGAADQAPAPLRGVRVVELGAVPAGAYCARIFADFGAEVVKIEPPEGDPLRRRGPRLAIGPGAEEGCHFGFLNAGKQSAVVDPSDPAACTRLHALLSTADVVIETLGEAERRALGLDHDALRAEAPDLVIVAASWFGESGPYRDFRATDTVCRALAGLVYLVGPKDGPPTPILDYQADIVGGLTAFIPAMAALQSGGGRRFEVSVFEAAIALADYNIALDWGAGRRDTRWGQNRFWPNYPLGIFRCKGGGWIGVTIVTPVQWAAFCTLLDMPDLIGDPAYAVNRDRIAVADALQARFAPAFLTRTAEDWLAIALEERLPFVIVPDMADLLADPEHRRRAVFARVRHGAADYDMPASPLRLTRTPPARDLRVPAFGGALADWTAPAVRRAPPRPKGHLPLEGVRVVDMAMGWAGPHATRHLADLGADVIKIEACQYPDWWRGVDNRPVVIAQRLYEKSSYFNVMNRNKRGITLDLTTPEGVALVRDLVRRSDIVVENYSAGVLTKLGLDYTALRTVKPDIVMVSMPAFAGDGPLRELRAYGSTLEQASGVPSVTGDPDGPPGMSHIAYGDPIGGLNAAAAILIALAHRTWTGAGQRIDLSQVECMLTMAAPWIIECSATGRVPPRTGTRHPAYAPFGAFPCRDPDSWVFVAVEDDAQWAALAALLGPAFASPDFATLDQRRARLDEIEAALAAWTCRHTPDAAMLTLQAAGIAAGAVRSPVDLLDDPHLAARGYWQVLRRAYVDHQPNPSPAFREDGRPLPIVRAAPTLGADNAAVLQGVLGLTDTDLARLAAAGIIGTDAVPPNLRKARAAIGAPRPAPAGAG